MLLFFLFPVFMNSVFFFLFFLINLLLLLNFKKKKKERIWQAFIPIHIAQGILILTFWQEKIAVYADQAYKHTLYQLLWPRKKPIKRLSFPGRFFLVLFGCLGFFCFFFFGFLDTALNSLILCSSTLATVFEEQKFFLRIFPPATEPLLQLQLRWVSH